MSRRGASVDRALLSVTSDGVGVAAAGRAVGPQAVAAGVDEHRFAASASVHAEVADAVELISGDRPVSGAAPYGSDLRLYRGIGGIPTLQYGPGDVRYAHAPREQVRISELIEVTRALAVMAVTRLGGHL